MAGDYISRAAALTALQDSDLFNTTERQLRAIRELPAADVAEVVHGWWGTHSDRPDSLICSVCNCGFDMWKHDPHNYCPNCGAKMDGEGERYMSI